MLRGLSHLSSPLYEGPPGGEGFVRVDRPVAQEGTAYMACQGSCLSSQGTSYSNNPPHPDISPCLHDFCERSLFGLPVCPPPSTSIQILLASQISSGMDAESPVSMVTQGGWYSTRQV